LTDPAHRLRLFVSAGTDLEAEHEAIGRGVAHIPVPSLGWAIGRTPRRGEPQFVAWEEIAAADLFVLILGRDIKAPVGVELLSARRVGKRVLAYRKNVRRTQAAEAFARDTAVDWIEYDVSQEVARLVQVALVETVLAQGLARGLLPVERDTLRGFLEGLRRGEVETPPSEEAGGAGGGGLILVPGKDLPPGGVLVPDEAEPGDESQEA
jgi:hypothetical protein